MHLILLQTHFMLSDILLFQIDLIALTIELQMIEFQEKLNKFFNVLV